MNFEVIKNAGISRHANGNDIRLVVLGAIALFSTSELVTSSGKHLVKTSHAHIVFLMYKLITSAKNSVDFSIGFDGDQHKRRDELTNNKCIKGKYHLRIMLKEVFGFAEHQEKTLTALVLILH